MLLFIRWNTALRIFYDGREFFSYDEQHFQETVRAYSDSFAFNASGKRPSAGLSCCDMGNGPAGYQQPECE